MCAKYKFGGQGDAVDLRGNPLSSALINVLMPQLEARGVDIEH